MSSGQYNPYDLLAITINGKSTYARPYELDSQIINDTTMENSIGEIVKPSKASTTCPDCGQLLDLELDLEFPPFAIIECTCTYCNKDVVPYDPFMNPFDRISLYGPLITRPDTNVIQAVTPGSLETITVHDDTIKTKQKPNTNKYTLSKIELQTKSANVVEEADSAIDKDLAGDDLEDLYE